MQLAKNIVSSFNNKEQATSDDNNELSDLQDPFKQDKFEQMLIVVGKGFLGNPQCYANIKFKSGMTTGEHRIEALNLAELLVKVDLFIKHLKQL